MSIIMRYSSFYGRSQCDLLATLSLLTEYIRNKNTEPIIGNAILDLSAFSSISVVDTRFYSLKEFICCLGYIGRVYSYNI